MNKAALVGRLTRDIELRYTQKGTACANFTIAINRRFKNPDGEYETDFINCVAWGAMGETASKYVGKGSQIGVTGRIQTRSYEANDGSRRYITEVVCDEIEFLGSKKNAHGNQGDLQPDYSGDFQPLEDDDDDLPF